LPEDPLKALPEFDAVTPAEVLTFSRSVLVPSSLMIAVPLADLPGRTVSWK
jgi:hypothetical protein